MEPAESDRSPLTKILNSSRIPRESVEAVNDVVREINRKSAEKPRLSDVLTKAPVQSNQQQSIDVLKLLQGTETKPDVSFVPPVAISTQGMETPLNFNQLKQPS